MLRHLTPEIETILARRIDHIEEITGELTRTVLLGNEGDHQYLLLVFTDGRWAFIYPTDTSRHNGYRHEHIPGLTLAQRDEFRSYIGKRSMLEKLYEAQLISEDQWQAQLELQRQKLEEQLAHEQLLDEQRKTAQAVAKEQSLRQRQMEEFIRALRLKYGHEATDKGLKQMKAAEQRRQSQA